MIEYFVKCKHDDAERNHAYVSRQAAYSEKSKAPSKLAYMSTSRRRPKSPFAVDRGHKIRSLRTSRGESQETFAKQLGVTREAVSLLESGSIKEPDLPVVRKLIAVGLDAADLLEDPSVLEMTVDLPDVTPDARRVAYAWDSMPIALRQYIGDQIQTWQRLKKSMPVLATLLSTEPDPKRRAQHDRQMEDFTKRFIEESRKIDKK
jgi:transcriptional regulator with XRE-family HTH domain